ncbi:hypothetical protein AERO8C_70567 [Aeromonas veronii]|uniref:Uncharacterized protein n=1 Tax=Aeromonas veronii TaxID=654 RepID=A0A653LDP4_AERVE|nr:hypothetical protein AERO8C_70567 [Aeromonas veronii]
MSERHDALAAGLTVVADLVGAGLKTLGRVDEFATGGQKVDQRFCIHLAGAAGMKTGLGTEPLGHRLFQAGTGKLPPLRQHHLHHFVTMNRLRHLSPQ